jgi:hypothetical protein
MITMAKTVRKRKNWAARSSCWLRLDQLLPAVPNIGSHLYSPSSIPQGLIMALVALAFFNLYVAIADATWKKGD